MFLMRGTRTFSPKLSESMQCRAKNSSNSPSMGRLLSERIKERSLSAWSLISGRDIWGASFEKKDMAIWRVRDLTNPAARAESS